MTFANQIIDFFENLHSPKLNNDIGVINPYEQGEVKNLVRDFYLKYFNDNDKRVFIIGINPGRFGGGLTGISFTDPVALRDICGIENSLNDKRELSSKFIYTMIERLGGPQKFYKKFYLTALYPLAIVKNGKNYNYYDELQLFQALKNEMISSLDQQIKCGARKDVAVCLGKKNFTFVEEINKEFKFFDELKVLEHPRYIMQYKLKQLTEYISEYASVLQACIE